MGGSIFGSILQVSTWGESHGSAVGVTVDGIPAGLPLTSSDIQKYLDRRKPGQSRYTTARKEEDRVEILSGIFEGMTTGTPISMMVRNADHHSTDYSAIKDVFRPGHADYTFYRKYGIRDYRGGGRSSGRETVGRVAAGAVACRFLSEVGISFFTYTKSIGPYEIRKVCHEDMEQNALFMPDADTARMASGYIEEAVQQQDSVGGVVECVVSNVPAGLGNPVFEKLDANLAKAMLSIGAVKGFEIGDGFLSSRAKGSSNNDAFTIQDNKIIKKTNHSGGVLGGISDGDRIIFRTAFKPTPSISQRQETVNVDKTAQSIAIHGRHDPVIVPRAVVVVEAMAALVIADALLTNALSRMDYIKKLYVDEE